MKVLLRASEPTVIWAVKLTTTSLSLGLVTMPEFEITEGALLDHETLTSPEALTSVGSVRFFVTLFALSPSW